MHWWYRLLGQGLPAAEQHCLGPVLPLPLTLQLVVVLHLNQQRRLRLLAQQGPSEQPSCSEG
jgi:hypothetical protein